MSGQLLVQLKFLPGPLPANMGSRRSVVILLVAMEFADFPSHDRMVMIGWLVMIG